MRSQADLANAVNHESVTAAVVQNLEAGRKAELTISQLLNIAFALQVPPSFLLAPLGNSTAKLDLPNLAPGVASMAPVEFDAWFSGLAGGAHRYNSTEEQQSISQLEAIRELAQARRELIRLRTIERLESQDGRSKPPVAGELPWDSLQDQIASADARAKKIEKYLQASGFVTRD